MRAFIVAWQAIVSFYNEMFSLIGLSVLWWLTGGIFVAAAAVFGWALLNVGGPWWLAPLLAIPAGPALAAMAHVARRAARDESVDRSYFWEGFRLYWRKALALNAASMAILTALLLNVIFYGNLSTPVLQVLAILWIYLAIFWLSVQVYLFPVLVGLKEPSVWRALRTTAVMAFANPFFSLVLLIVAIALTALCVVLAILLPLAWPAVIVLIGEQGFRVLVEKAGLAEKKKTQ